MGSFIFYEMMKIQATAINVNRLIQGLILFIATCTAIALILQILHAGSFSVIPALVSALGVSQFEYAHALARTLWLWKVSLVITLASGVFLWCLIWRRWMGKLWTYVSEKSRFSSSTTTIRSIVFMLAWFFITCPVLLLQTGTSGIESGGLQSLLFASVISVSLSTLIYYKLAKHYRPVTVFAAIFTLRMLLLFGSFYQLYLTFSMYPSLQRNDTNEVVFKLAEQANFPLNNIKMLPMSLNALYANCLFGEYIAIGTGIEKEELGGVVSHELGHRKNKDFIKRYIFVLMEHFINSALPSLVIPAFPIIYEAFGFTTEPIIAAVSISSFLGVILENFLAPIKLTLIRRDEYRADQNSIELGYSETLIRFLSRSHWQTAFSANSFFEFLLLSHPSSLRRIENIQKQKENK